MQVYGPNQVIWQTATSDADGRRGEAALLILHQNRLCRLKCIHFWELCLYYWFVAKCCSANVYL